MRISRKDHLFFEDSTGSSVGGRGRGTITSVPTGASSKRGGAGVGGSLGGVGGVGAAVRFPEGYEMSEVEKVEAHVRKVQLEYEKDKLMDMIEHTVEAFDEAVRTLRQVFDT